MEEDSTTRESRIREALKTVTTPEQFGAAIIKATGLELDTLRSICESEQPRATSADNLRFLLECQRMCEGELNRRVLEV